MRKGNCKEPGKRAKNVWRILELLGRHGELSFSRLQELTRLKKGTLGKTLSRMKSERLVQKKDEKNRKSSLCLGECGKEIWKEHIKKKGQMDRWKETLEQMLKGRGDVISLAHLVVRFEGCKAMKVLDYIGWREELPKKTDESSNEEDLSHWREIEGGLQFVFFTPPCYHLVVSTREAQPQKLYIFCGVLGKDPLGVTDLAKLVGPSALVTLAFQHLLTLMCHLAWEASMLGHRTVVEEFALADFQEKNFWGSTEERYWTDILAEFSRNTTKLFRRFPLRFDELGED